MKPFAEGSSPSPVRPTPTTLNEASVATPEQVFEARTKELLDSVGSGHYAGMAIPPVDDPNFAQPEEPDPLAQKLSNEITQVIAAAKTLPNREELAEKVVNGVLNGLSPEFADGVSKFGAMTQRETAALESLVPSDGSSPDPSKVTAMTALVGNLRTMGEKSPYAIFLSHEQRQQVNKIVRSAESYPGVGEFAVTQMNQTAAGLTAQLLAVTGEHPRLDPTKEQPVVPQEHEEGPLKAERRWAPPKSSPRFRQRAAAGLRRIFPGLKRANSSTPHRHQQTRF